MIPVFAPLKQQINFSQHQIAEELLHNEIDKHSVLATTTFEDGQSRWKGVMSFEDEKFSKTKDVIHYEDKSDTHRSIIRGMDTFWMTNLTYHDERSRYESWDYHRTIPLWVEHQQPWIWRDDLQIPYTKSIIEMLPFEHVTTVRCIIQTPPSIGVIHADSGKKMNQKYYADGNGSITLNILSGGANLYVETDTGEKMIDESKWKVWHFDDSHPHCTTETKTKRIQLRVFGKLESDYKTFLDFEHAIY